MTQENQQPRTYSLSVLFLVIATCSVVSGLISPVSRLVASGKLGMGEAAIASVAGTVAVMILGGLIGLSHYRRLRGLLWGSATGGAVGMIVGPLALAPVSAMPAMLSISIGGGLLLLLVGLALGVKQRV